MASPDGPASTSDDRSTRTRDALVREATRLFGDRGYAATSLDAVVTSAGVTKGALYHHFSGKRDLFAAVFEQVEHELLSDGQRRTAGADTQAAEGVANGLRQFLENARTPAYVQIVLRDAPSVLGWTAQDPSHRPGYPALTGLLRRVVGPTSTLDEAALGMLSRMLFSALLSAASAISTAEDPDAELELAERSLHLLIAGVRHVGLHHEELAALTNDTATGTGSDD